MSKPPNPELINQILSIALEELGNNPPDKVSMRRIAEKAGVTPTTIYYYFASKEALFERIKFDAMDELEKKLSQALDGISTSRDRLSALMRNYAIWCLERPHLAKLLLETLPAEENLNEQSMEKYYATFNRAQKLCQEAISDGTLTQDRNILLDVSIIQASIWGLVVQFRSKRIHPQFWDSFDPLIERLIEMYLGSEGN